MTDTLDPSDWAAFRAVCHEAIDDMVDHMAGIGDGPAWQTVPQAARDALAAPLPTDPAPLAAVYGDFREHVLPYPLGNAHPRFWGWVMGNGTAEGMLADMLAAGMNPHVGGYDQAATLIERQVLGWLREVMGYPDDGGALLVSGGTMANLIGVLVARNAHDSTVRQDGVDPGQGRLTLYGSSDTHSWVEKSADIIGLGRSAFRRVACLEDGTLDLEALAQAVAADRAAGHRPLCVIGNAGTVDGGAVDDLDAIADFCEAEQLWFHVDGAFGALLALAPAYRDRLRGMERSDSLAFDLHKWGYVQYELGCVLVRDAQLQRQAFETNAAYLAPAGRGIQPDALEFSAMGPQLSRGFRALKVWMTLQTHGTSKLGRMIERNVAQAQRLVERIAAEPQLELLGPAPLNVVCFRYRPQGVDAAPLDRINKEVLLRIQESGLAVPSSTIREGHFALRIAITNHRTVEADIDLLADAVLSHGAAIATDLAA
ncbi:MAG: pyridoxal-dependent decarboxylase [Pseudomonadota bacterium]